MELPIKELRTEIKIKASHERVWEILTDFPKHAHWNPFIRQISGDLEVGARLEVEMGTPGKRVMKFKPKVITVRPEETFRWLGHLFIPGLFDGEHIFEIEPIEDGYVLFIQREKFHGVLVRFLWHSLNTDTREGFTLMNQALKDRVEGSTSQYDQG